MTQKDQGTPYELEPVLSLDGKVLGYQIVLFKNLRVTVKYGEIVIPAEPSDSFPVELTDHVTPEPPLKGLRKALRFFRGP